MQFGIILNTGTLDQIGDLAEAAEQAGWDGVFYWDAVHLPDFGEMHDPWVALTVIAQRTTGVTLGAIVMAVPRHKPWQFARAATSVDHASHGRLVLPVGLGALDDTAFAGVGEPAGTRERAERLDDTLEFLAKAWTGEPFRLTGRHHRTDEMTFLPRPVRGTIPVWVVGAWPRERSMERVLRHDGLMPNKLRPEGGQEQVTPDDIRAMADWIRARRPNGLVGFDIVAEGRTTGTDAEADEATVRPWAEAGATWWTDADWRGSLADLQRRVEAGPPRLG